MLSSTRHLRALAEESEPWEGPLPAGEVIATWRRAINASQEQLASVVESSRLSIRHYESGEVAESRVLSSPWGRKVVTALFNEAARGQKVVGR